MKNTINKLRAANPGSQPKSHPYSGSGLWLRWHAPSGELILIGVAVCLNGTNYRQLPDPADISATVTALWGANTARQLNKLLDATSNALYSGKSLPEGISSEPIPFCHGNNPGHILDYLWQHGPAQSILLKKKPPSQEAERSIDASTHVAEPAEPERMNLAGDEKQASPEKTGVKGRARKN